VSAQFKLAALLVSLVAISFAAPILLAIAAMLLIAISGVRAPRLLRRAAIVLPFGATLALAIWFSQGTAPALTLLARSYVSTLAVVLFSATTPVTAWTTALYSWRIPPTLILTLQFLYRYLSVLADEAHRMRIAARSRGGFRFDAAAGAIAVLFARAWERAEAVHRSMLARGFQGRFL
jgi:cobalt/nickel transport system permease protein